MSKLHISFFRYPGKQRTSPLPPLDSPEFNIWGLKHCPRQLTVVRSITGSRVWRSAAEVDGRSEFIFNNSDKKLIYYRLL